MPEAARQYSPVSRHIAAPRADSAWAGESHGAVGAMHRAIQERLLATGDTIAVIPGVPRPAERILRAASRIAGWASVATCFAGAAFLIF